MSQSAAPPTKRRWSPRLQFSLRLLLAAFTAFAIGFPIWYRWPYEEEELVYTTKLVRIGGGWENVPDKSQPPYERIVKTLRRQWGSLEGMMLRREAENFSQRIKTVEHFQDGLRHGTAVRYENGVVACSGQYERGMREGVWVDYGKDVKSTARWRRGKLDGLYEVEAGGRQRTQVLFAAGRIVQRDGQPVENLLFDRLEAREIDKYTAAELRRPIPVGMAFVETPLMDAVQYLQDQHNIPFQLDRRGLPDINLPISAEYEGLDLCSALAFMLEPYGLACDYRYGCLWVTTAESPREWRDPTGTSELQPPSGSPLAHEWDRISPIGVEALDQPLDAALQDLAKQHGVASDLDTSQIAVSPAHPQPITVRAIARGLPLRHMLGILLYNSGCRCKLEDGKLVILSPEENAESK